MRLFFTMFLKVPVYCESFDNIGCQHFGINLTTLLSTLISMYLYICLPYNIPPSFPSNALQVGGHVALRHEDRHQDPITYSNACSHIPNPLPEPVCFTAASPCIFSLTFIFTSKNLETHRSKQTDSPLLRSDSR